MEAILNALQSFGVVGTPIILVIAAIFTRVSIIAFLLPGLGERFITVRIRLMVALAVTSIIAPPVLAQNPLLPISLGDLTALFGAEAINGALIGFSLRLMVFILQIAGAIIAQHLSLAQLFDSSLSLEAESPFSTVLVLGGLTLAVGAGLHFHVVDAIISSYVTLPLGDFPGAMETGEWSAIRIGSAFLFALSLSLPFVVLGFIYSLALAAASRAMPQLMAAFVGAPAITFAGLVLFAATAPIILYLWLDALNQLLPDLLASDS